MASKRKTWMPAPPRRTKPQVPDSIKGILKEKADEIIENVLKPEHIKPPPTDNDFNYLVDIYSKWYRNYFYFCAKYASPGPNAMSPHFETKFARLEYVAEDRYHLSYMRHTDKWWEVYRDLSLAECLNTIRDDPLFMP